MRNPERSWRFVQYRQELPYIWQGTRLYSVPQFSRLDHIVGNLYFDCSWGNGIGRNALGYILDSDPLSHPQPNRTLLGLIFALLIAATWENSMPSLSSEQICRCQTNSRRSSRDQNGFLRRRLLVHCVRDVARCWTVWEYRFIKGFFLIDHYKFLYNMSAITVYIYQSV